MHDLRFRALIRRRVASGDSLGGVARELGIPYSTAARWVQANSATDADPPAPCWVCGAGRTTPRVSAASEAYAYVLGQYLGDGHLVTRARVPVLRIYACTDYPAITQRIVESIRLVRRRPPGIVRIAASARVLSIQSYWKHWPCLFPQHGPGRKHERPIVLADWQQDLVTAEPWALLRGLLHSDGCRSVNAVTVRGRRYAYPRWFLANESRDILALAGRTLDQVGVSWRYNRPNSISIARRAAVAEVDARVGLKR